MTAAAAQGELIVSPPVQVGTTTSNTLKETSDIAGSRSIPGVLWTHNDSGDLARFIGITTSGTVLGQYTLSGVFNTDWEDMAIGPKAGGGNYLYFGDIGDNDKNRSSVSIYRTTEPDTIAPGGTIPAAQIDRAILQYPTGPKNSESLMVDPWTGDLFIVTKSPSEQVYRAPADVFDHPGTTTVLQSLGVLNAFLSEPSAADISPDGTHILIRNRSTTAYIWERHVGQSVWDALQTQPIAVQLAAETQGEAIGWAADGKGFYTTSEWDNAGARPIYYYAVSVSVPEPGSFVLGMMALVAVLAVWKRRG
jgi:hypothetical protein